MNMICWLAKYFLRIFFSMNIENEILRTYLKLKLSCFAGLLLD